MGNIRGKRESGSIAHVVLQGPKGSQERGKQAEHEGERVARSKSRNNARDFETETSRWTKCSRLRCRSEQMEQL